MESIETPRICYLLVCAGAKHIEVVLDMKRIHQLTQTLLARCGSGVVLQVEALVVVGSTLQRSAVDT